MKHSNPNSKKIAANGYPEDYFSSRLMSTYEVEKIIEGNRETQSHTGSFWCDMMILGLIGFALNYLVAPSIKLVRDRVTVLEARASVQDIVTRPASYWFSK